MVSFDEVAREVSLYIKNIYKKIDKKYIKIYKYNPIIEERDNGIGYMVSFDEVAREVSLYI